MQGLCHPASSLWDSASSGVSEAISWHEVIGGKAVLQQEAGGVLANLSLLPAPADKDPLAGGTCARWGKSGHGDVQLPRG